MNFIDRLSFQFLQPPCEETTLRLLPSQRQCLLIRNTSLRNPPQPATQIRTGRVREVIIGKFLARQQTIDKAQTLLGSLPHRDGNCAVQFHHRRWLNTNQPVVEQRNLAPVRRRRRSSLSMNRRNGRLQRVRTETTRCKCPRRQRDALRNLIPVPQQTILMLQQNQLPLRRASRRATRLLQQHQPQQAHHLRLRKKLEKQSTQTNSLAAQFRSCCHR